MKKLISTLAIITTTIVNAHFLTFIPFTDNVNSKKQATIKLDAMFIHPFEQTGMTMEKPFGIFLGNKKEELPK